MHVTDKLQTKKIDTLKHIGLVNMKKKIYVVSIAKQ